MVTSGWNDQGENKALIPIGPEMALAKSQNIILTVQVYQVSNIK